MPMKVPVALTHSAPCRQAFTRMHLALLLSVAGQTLVIRNRALKLRIKPILPVGRVAHCRWWRLLQETCFWFDQTGPFMQPIAPLVTRHMVRIFDLLITIAAVLPNG
jgi:hypothetical protein